MRIQEPESTLELLAKGGIVCYDADEARSRFQISIGPNGRFAGFGPEALADIEAWAKAILPEDRAQATAICQRDITADSGGHAEMEYQIAAPDGSRRWVRELTRRSEEGGWRGVLIDVTARREAEEALAEKAAFVESLNEATPAIVYIFDLEKRENVYVNRHFGDFLGYTSAQIAEMGPGFMLQIVHPDDLANLEALLARWDNAGDQDLIQTPYRVRDAKGEWRYYHGRDRVFRRDAEGRVTQIIGTAVDITDLTRAEEQKLELTRQMQHMQKLESLGVLAGGIAHDFNNLLGAILGNLELAQLESGRWAEPGHPLEAAKTAVERAAELCSQMLAYAGKAKPSMGPLEVGQLAHEMMALLEVTFSKKVRLRFTLAKDLPQIHGDSAQISQVLMNLITNAAEAIGDQGGEISVSARMERPRRERLAPPFIGAALGEEEMVCVEVADTGCGIEPAIIERIFDPFFTTKFQGRGLGMAAVSGIVRSHGGVIELESAPGLGATFRALFPAAGSGGQEPKQAAAGRGRLGARLGGAALIADDEPLLRSLLRKTLGLQGIETIEAVDGADALQKLDAYPGRVALAILDVNMPGLSGIECMRAIRDRGHAFPVILCSGYIDALERREGDEMRDVVFLPKPYSIGQIADAMVRVMVK